MSNDEICINAMVICSHNNTVSQGDSEGGHQEVSMVVVVVWLAGRGLLQDTELPSPSAACTCPTTEVRDAGCESVY